MTFRRVSPRCDHQVRRFLNGCSSGFDQPGGFVALEQVEHEFQAATGFAREPPVALERSFGSAARAGEKAGVDVEPREAEAGRAGLAGAEHVAFAAQLQVLFGDAEAVLRLTQDFQPGARGFVERPPVKERQAERPAPRPTRPRN